MWFHYEHKMNSWSLGDISNTHPIQSASRKYLKINLPALIMHSLFLISYRIKMSSVIVQNLQNTLKRWYLPKKAYYAHYTWSDKKHIMKHSLLCTKNSCKILDFYPLIMLLTTSSSSWEYLLKRSFSRHTWTCKMEYRTA